MRSQERMKIDEEPVLVENLKLETGTNCRMSQNWLQLFRMVLGIPGLEMILQRFAKSLAVVTTCHF